MVRLFCFRGRVGVLISCVVPSWAPVGARLRRRWVRCAAKSELACTWNTSSMQNATSQSIAHPFPKKKDATRGKSSAAEAGNRTRPLQCVERAWIVQFLAASLFEHDERLEHEWRHVSYLHEGRREAEHIFVDENRVFNTVPECPMCVTRRREGTVNVSNKNRVMLSRMIDRIHDGTRRKSRGLERCSC